MICNCIYKDGVIIDACAAHFAWHKQLNSSKPLKIAISTLKQMQETARALDSMIDLAMKSLPEG